MSGINIYNPLEFIAVLCMYLLPILIVYKLLKNFRILKLQKNEEIMLTREHNKVLEDINKNLILIYNTLTEEKGSDNK